MGQNKVQFVDETGNAFFECHASEARAAVKAVEDFRTGEKDKRELREIKAAADALYLMAKSVAVVPAPLPPAHALTIEGLNQMFVQLEKEDLMVTHIFVSATRYADLRNWGKMVFDVETKKEMLMIGCLGHIWSADIFVRKEVPEDVVIVASGEGVRRPSHVEGVPRPPKYRAVAWKFDCSGPRPKTEGELIVERLDRIEKMLDELLRANRKWLPRFFGR